MCSWPSVYGPSVVEQLAVAQPARRSPCSDRAGCRRTPTRRRPASPAAARGRRARSPRGRDRPAAGRRAGGQSVRSGSYPLHERDPRFRHTTTLVPSTSSSRPSRCARRRATWRRSRPSSTRSRPALACSTRRAGSACSPPASRCAGSAPRPPTPARAWSRTPARTPRPPPRGAARGRVRVGGPAAGPALRRGVLRRQLDRPRARPPRRAAGARGHAQTGRCARPDLPQLGARTSARSRTDGTHTWEIPPRWDDPHTVTVAVGAVSERLTYWPFTYEQLREDLGRPVARSCKARSHRRVERYMVTAHRVPSDIDARRGQWSVAGMAGAGRGASPGEPGGPWAGLVLRHPHDERSAAAPARRPRGLGGRRGSGRCGVRARGRRGARAPARPPDARHAAPARC